MNPAFLRNGINCLALSILLTGCNRQSEETPEVTRGKPADYFETHFQDESQFIVETILTDLAEMAAYARSGQVPSEVVVSATERGDSKFRIPTYEVKLRADSQVIQRSLEVKGPIWSPELYEDSARALLVGDPTLRQDPNDISVLLALTDFQPSTIETENQRISSLLQTNFNDPTLHEIAAVLLGTFALRELTDDFYDIRLPLCRLTAHLTLARVLSGGAGVGPNGKAAEIMLYTLMNNQKAALAKLAALETEPRLKPWVNALHARNTYDYRDLQIARDRTRLESVMFYLAISRCVRSDAGWDQLPEELVVSSTDFARIAFAEDFSVGLGHQLHGLGLRLEREEIAEIHSLVTGGALSGNADVVKFLNHIPERCFVPGSNLVRVIGSGQWAAFLQRHLCHALRHDFNFLNAKWGVREEAKEFAAATDAAFGALRLYPFVRRYHATTEAEYKRAVDEGQPVTAAMPHLVGADIWNYLANPPRFAPHYWPGVHAHVNEWHKHNPPPGTAYNPGPRLYHPSLVNRADAATVLAELHELAPYDGQIADGLITARYQGRENYEQAEEILRPLLPYSARQNLHLARQAAADSVRYEEIMVRYARLNPAGYFTLGQYFADRQDVAKASSYYEQGVEESKDDVLISNSCGWLVRHYFKSGELEKAETLADRAAEVYSSGGLRTKADLLEMQKKFDEALEYYRRNEERYNQPGPLVGFCVRYKAETGDARFDKLLHERLKTLFPRGLETVDISHFSAPPQQGVVISQDNDLLRQAGLKKGDIIVALDGTRVYDMLQYMHVRDRTNAAVLRLVVWNGNEYAEKTASPPKRRFGVPFNDYHQPAKK